MASRMAAASSVCCRSQHMTRAICTAVQPSGVYHNRRCASQSIVALDESVRNGSHRFNANGNPGIPTDDLILAGLRDLQSFVSLAETRRRVLSRTGAAFNDTVPEPRGVSKQNLTEATLQPLPIEVFRERLRACRTPNHKLCRIMITAQLFHCQTPEDMRKILVIVMTHPLQSQMARTLAKLEVPITRAWYRCRQAVSDRQVLRSIIQFIRRFEMANVAIDARYYITMVKFGARCRDLDLMRRCLSLYKKRVHYMSDHMFRAVVAKCSIGRWGLGAIRNGYWISSDLRQVVCGFDAESHLPDEERCHLETFLDRRTWKFVYAWIAVLGVAKANDKLWSEWNIWKQTPARRVPKRLQNIDTDVDSRTRGDTLFMESLQLAGRGDRAWEVFRESNIILDTLKPWVLLDLVKNAYFSGDRAAELQKILHARYGDRILQSGQPLRTICVDACDSSGHPVFSRENATAMYECLKDSLGPLATYGLMSGETLAACREAHMLHEAELCETIDEDNNRD